MSRFVLKHEENTFSFLRIVYKSNKDGTIIIVFDHDNQSEKLYTLSFRNDIDSSCRIDNEKKKFRISYHPTGIVNYHSKLPHTIYCDPLSNLSIPFVLASINVNDFYVLNPIESVPDDTYFIELSPPLSYGFTVNIVMSPSIYTPSEEAALSIKLDYDLFSIFLEFYPYSVIVSKENDERIVIVAPAIGLYSKPLSTKDDALIEFHKNYTKQDGVIIYWNENSGVYRIIFETTMRVPPSVKILLEEQSLTVEIIKKTKSEIYFKVRGRGGYIKYPVKISSVELDAEL